MRSLACGIALALAGGCAIDGGPADLLLVHGTIVTVDAARPRAQALAVRDGRILAVGSDAEIERYRGPSTEVLDLQGRLAIPGFIDSHAHFTGVGRSLTRIDLRSAETWEETVQRVAEAARREQPGEWVLGWGWHQDKWTSPPQPGVEGYPTHDLLSRAIPDNPVLLKHAAGSHAGIVNAAALRLAGIDETTPDPPGGKILRDPAGRPTGVLRETAYDLALRVYEESRQRSTAEERDRQARREIELADRECLSKGITSLHDAGSDFETVDRLRSMAESGRLGVRLYVMLEEPNDALERRIEAYRIIGAADDHLTVRSIKRWIDGALGSHGAWLLEPYADQPQSAGLNVEPLAELERTARIARDHGFQLCVHAIGDRGNRETLDLYERVLEGGAGEADSRWRIEHAQHVAPEEIPRFARLGVIAAMQGIHCTSDGPWVPRRLGESRAAQGAYVWRKLLDAGAVICNGTDAPVEDLDPIANFHASVTREMPNGVAFHPEQRMTRDEALRSYTIDAAYAAFEEELKGSLTPGKLADVTVLSQDILTVSEDRIPETEVLLTIVGGKVRYRKSGA